MFDYRVAAGMILSFLSILVVALLTVVYESGESHLQTLSDARNCSKAGIALASFNAAYKCSVYPGRIGEIFLGHAQTFTSEYNGFPKAVI